MVELFPPKINTLKDIKKITFFLN